MAARTFAGVEEEDEDEERDEDADQDEDGTGDAGDEESEVRKKISRKASVRARQFAELSPFASRLVEQWSTRFGKGEEFGSDEDEDDSLLTEEWVRFSLLSMIGGRLPLSSKRLHPLLAIRIACRVQM